MILTLVAVTAPVELDDPVAVMQSPTARLAEVVDSVCITVVDDDTAIVMSEGATVVGLVELDVPDLKPAPDNLTPSTTIEVDPAETNFPVMTAALASPLREKPDPPPAGKLRGGLLPVGERLPAAPPKPPANPPPPRPKPEVQLPEDEGGETVTDRALTVEPDAVPITVTHVPAESDETVKVAVLENLVEEVQSTVSCPAVGFCTSIDVPEMAATEPDVPGKAPPPRPPNPVGDVATVVEVELVAALEAPPPQAARATVSVTARVVIVTD